MNEKVNVQCGIIGPLSLNKSEIDPKEIQAYFRRAEELGFHSVWLTEQSGFRARIAALESMTLMSYAAAVTTRIRLGYAVMLINLRNPIEVAKGMASIDQLSQGRVILGLALGASAALYPAYGLSSEHRVARFNETLEYIKRLWTEEDLTFEGRYYQVKNANLLPKPFQKPHPPIWLGGNVPAALKRGVRHGSGYIGAGSSSTADFRANVQIIRQELEAAGKDPEQFFLAKRVNLAVDKDRARAHKRLREWFGAYYNDPDRADRVCVWGKPDQIVEEIQEVVSAGARLVILSPVFDGLEQMEILASEVVPHLTG